MTRWFWKYLGIFLLLASNVQAQQALTLSEAIQIALENNYQIRVAENNQSVAETNNDWVVAGRYPTVDFTVNSQNGYTNISNPVSFVPRISSVSVGVTPQLAANMVLFDGYRIRYNKQRLEELERQSDIALDIAVENTIQEVITAYYAALLNREQLDVLENVLQLSRDRVAYDAVRQEFGQATTFDRLQTQDAFLNDSTSYLAQKLTYENSMRNLKLAMGLDDLNVAFEPTDELAVPEDDYDYEAMRERMIVNNRQLQNLFVDREIAKVNTQIEESEMLPQVNVGTGASYDVSLQNGEGEQQNGETLEIDAIAARTFRYFVNLNASYTLFDWGARRKNIENAKVQELSAQYNIDELKRNLNTQLLNTYATYQNQKRLVQLNSELLENAQQNLDIAGERFRGGLINSFDYRSIQLSYIQASQQRLQAIFDLKVTETELIRLIGGLVRQ